MGGEILTSGSGDEFRGLIRAALAPADGAGYDQGRRHLLRLERGRTTMHSAFRTWGRRTDGRIRTGARVRRSDGRDGFASNEDIREIFLPSRAAARRDRAAGAGERRPLPALLDRRTPAPTPAASRAPTPEPRIRRDHELDGGDTCTAPPAIAVAPLQRHRDDERQGQQQRRFFAEGEYTNLMGVLSRLGAGRRLHLHDRRVRK